MSDIELIAGLALTDLALRALPNAAEDDWRDLARAVRRRNIRYGCESCDTLTALDVSNNPSLGGGTVAWAELLSAVAASSVTHVDVTRCGMGSEGGKSLVGVLPSSSIKSLKIGRSFEISTEKYEETAVDCSKQDFGPGEVIVLSWWLSTEATAGMAVVDISENLISGSKYVRGY